MTMTTPQGSGRSGLVNLVRYALSDLRYRYGTTMLNIAATALSGAYILILGHYAAGVYCHQQAVVDSSLQTRVGVATPDVTDRERRFTEERIAALRAIPGVTLVYPHLELNVRLSLDGKAADVPAEGTVPQDPALAPGRLAWGRGIVGIDAREAVLSRSLFAKLGGTVGGRLHPDRATLQVSRTAGGRQESRAVELRVVGLVNHPGGDRVYLPLGLADTLDLWCTHKIDNLTSEPGKGRSARNVYPFCLAYAPMEQAGRVEAEAKALGVVVERLGEIDAAKTAGPAPTQRLVRYRVRDPRDPEGQVRDDLVAVLAMSRPTFVACHPHLSIEGHVGAAQGPTELVASGPSDPARFAVRLAAGTWLRGEGGPYQIVLPSPGPDDADAARSPAPGTTLIVHVRRGSSPGRNETLALPLRVVGIVEGKTAYIPLELASDLEGWCQGRLMFDETRRAFEEPVELTRRSGHVRCVVYARDSSSVDGVVQALRRMGYHTEDRLAEQEGLRRLGRVLVFVVGFFVMGIVLNAALTVLISTMMNVRSKAWEIGILRAHGLGNGAVVGIFAAQGLLIGAAAFACAALATGLLEPLLTRVVCETFSLKEGAVLTGSPFKPGRWWLPATVLVVLVVFSLFGVAVPAAWACRRSPVEVLRNRE